MPVQFQETVRLVYYVYLVYVLALVINAVASLLYMLFAGGSIGKFILTTCKNALNGSDVS